jgi:hypothetical protein
MEGINQNRYIVHIYRNITTKLPAQLLCTNKNVENKPKQMQPPTKNWIQVGITYEFGNRSFPVWSWDDNSIELQLS